MEIKLETVIPFGKYKGYKVEDILPDVDSEFDARFVKPVVKYFAWVKRETSYTLNKEVLERCEHILLLILKPSFRDSSSYRGRLEHWNDMGSMSGVSFQDVYGDFGY